MNEIARPGEHTQSNTGVRDAVHGLFICSQRETPDVAAAFRAQRDDGEYDFDPVNLPDFSERERPYVGAPWNENHESIPALSAYCKEGAHQDMLDADAFCALLTLRRNKAREFVGTKWRPHLDGYPLEILQALTSTR